MFPVLVMLLLLVDVLLNYTGNGARRLRTLGPGPE